jgi:hypothetical protein
MFLLNAEVSPTFSFCCKILITLHWSCSRNLISSRCQPIRDGPLAWGLGGMACYEILRRAYKILVEEIDGKRPPGRPIRTWEDNIRLDLVEIRWKGVDWIHLAQHGVQWRPLVSTAVILGAH